ncbi:hypothetical protein L7F22_011000 [Adiantum nelumboides]|nr:hypothetical protein [Adiantum nelumboides]
MIPSANSTGDLSAWHTDSWADHAAAAAAIATTPYNSSSAPPAADHSRYLSLHRHQILDWENAMLLASTTHHSSASSDPVYDHAAADYNKAAGISPGALHADALASLPHHPRHYEDLLSAHMASSANSAGFTNNNAWGLLNTVCSRTSGNSLQQETSLLQAAGAAQYNSYETLNGADGLGAYGGLGTAAAAGLYADSLRSSSSSSAIGLSSFDQRRLDDIMKRELYTTHDLNSRLGLNLGGRTYFSADDFAFGRWGKRPRPNSPGCMMQPAPLCQAEGCKADLSMAKHYHRRHKVCEYHSKAATVHIGDQTQRFCQQCSRFHVLDEFDDGKRSCRKRLADHNRRRRKPQPTPATTVAEATTTAAAAGDANADDQQPDKEPSQEATTGSDSVQTGTLASNSSTGI